MKLLLTSILSLLYLTSYSQLPEIKTTIDDFGDQDKIIYKIFAGKYDFLIAYTTESYWWADKFNYTVLALKNDKWEQLKFSCRKKKNGQFSRPAVTKSTFDSELANNLIKDLSKLSFWNLNNDSLNIRRKRVNDSTETSYSLSDGVNYKFEIVKNNNYRVVEAYEPEYFLKKMPEIRDREISLKQGGLLNRL